MTLQDDILMIVYKHLPGQHEQKLHGRRGNLQGSYDNTSDYSERARELYETIPEEIRAMVKAPGIIEDNNISGAQTFLGSIRINPTDYKPRVNSNFAHEFGHHFDINTGVTDTEKFSKAFEKSKERAKNIEELPYPENGKYLQRRNWENIGSMVNALTGGKKGWGPAAHGEGYLSVPGHDRKEAFAIAFESNVYYMPSFFKLFPEMGEFFND